MAHVTIDGHDFDLDRAGRPPAVRFCNLPLVWAICPRGL